MIDVEIAIKEFDEAMKIEGKKIFYNGVEVKK